MPVTVRRAVAADAAVLIVYNSRMAQETEGKALDPALVDAGVRAGLADERKAIYFVAEENGVVVGQLMITSEWSDWRNGWFWWIQSVYVHPESRRRGVFRALHEHVLQTARQTPEVIGLRLYVERENHAARQTYQQLGMTETSYLLLEQYPL
jgi:ribosomal protein S18 acetylase RimI-like enzyme